VTPGIAIDVEGLTKSFGGRTVVRNLSMQVRRGQIYGFLGPNGSGKTTTIRMLCGLLTPDSGRGTCLGYDIRAEAEKIKLHVGYMTQRFSLYDDLSVRENLEFIARIYGIPSPSAAARAAITRLGLHERAEQIAGSLSGGWKQRLALGACTLPNPQLLLLDEPTAGVDVVARAEIWTMLERERAASLVLMSTSYLDEAAACDRLVYLDQGRLVATGTPAELRAAVPVEVYRAWGDDARAIARAARELPYVDGARATGRFVRVDVRRERTPGAERVVRDLTALPGGAVRFAERAEVDMESALIALSSVA